MNTGEGGGGGEVQLYLEIILFYYVVTNLCYSRRKLLQILRNSGKCLITSMKGVMEGNIPPSPSYRMAGSVLQLLCQSVGLSHFFKCSSQSRGG